MRVMGERVEVRPPEHSADLGLPYRKEVPFTAYCGRWGREVRLCSLPEINVAIVASNAIIASMATLTIRQLDEKTKSRLRIRAAHHGRSMEEEAREILRSTLTASSRPKWNLADAIHRRFAAFGGIELLPVKRDALRDIPDFEE